MNKYKLIKEYPGSLRLGTKILSDDTQFVTNFPEYWEEVVEKEYEILSIIFESSNRIDTLRENGLYAISTGSNKQETGKYSIDCYYLGWEIHSVKRLSDGEVFTIGDEIIDEDLGVCSIRGFKIINNKMHIIYLDYDYPLEKTIKHKQKLFTTEDGVDIYEGNKYWCINIKDFNYWASICKSKTQLHKDYRAFSTEKAAENYIKCHKPVLSYNDVSKIMIDYNGDFSFREFLKPILTKLVKEKL